MSSHDSSSEAPKARNTSSVEPAPRSAPLYRAMPYPTTPKQLPKLVPKLPARPQGQQQQQQQQEKPAPLLEASQPFPPTAPLLPPSASPALGSPSRHGAQPQMFKKAKPRKKMASVALAKTSRWIMSDDLLHRFRKVEAQEILTEDQIRKLKQSREAAEKESRPTESEAAQDANSTETLADNAEGAGSSELSPKQTSVFPSSSPPSTSTLSQVPKRNQASASSLSSPPAPVVRHDFSAPSKSQNSNDAKSLPPTPRSPSLARHTALATIPEVTLTAPPGSSEPSPTTNSPFSTINPISPVSVLSASTSDGIESATPRNDSISSVTSAASAASQYEPSEDDEYIYFHGAPTSATTPTFRHGRIRISKAESGIRMSGENNLDWTAFQMAILGAGDWFSDLTSNDITSPVCEVGDVDDLADWFYGLNLPDCPEPSANDDAPPMMPPAITEVAPADADCPPPPYSASEYDAAGGKSARLYSALGKDPSEFNSEYHSDASPPPSLSSTPRSSDDIPRSSACIFPPAPTPRCQPSPYDGAPWSPPRHQKYSHQINLSVDSARNVRRPSATGGYPSPPRQLCMMASNESLVSLPQSPMPPIAKSPADEADFIPMGYNLGHDLGDFLRWEAQHVYASSPQ
ncbi:hypothetical protein Cpir12675_004477 [Ceratocystis pirilliformis]|uniref:Uncharacterized protein n=1 Tax=Ceratocystis pirilliformis TaxID=259994 RepID=A0ABR3YXB6_9PEZI